MDTILGVFRPPSSSFSAFNSKFPSVLTNQNNNVVLIGDFNVDICACSYLSSVDELIVMSVCDGYDFLINIPTRVTKDSRTCLNHIYVKSSFQYKSGVIKFDISDHYVTFLQLISKALSYSEL